MNLALLYMVVLIGALGAPALAHTCLLNPLQRGDSLAGLNSVGAPVCGNLNTSQCGNMPAQAPLFSMVAGSNYTVVFQKNENHWTAAFPVAWVLSIAQTAASNMQFLTLSRFLDANTPSLSILEEAVTLPMVLEPTPMTIQLQYVCAFGTFYQCADIMVLPDESL